MRGHRNLNVSYRVVNVRSPLVILGSLLLLVLLVGAIAVVGLWPAGEPDVELREAPARVAAPPKGAAQPAPHPVTPPPLTTGALGLAVVDDKGQPVAGAIVELVGAARMPSQETDIRGEVRFRAVPAGAWKVRVQATRFSMLEDGPVEVKPGKNAEFEATLQPLQILIGRVVDPDGNGKDGAQVEIWPEGNPGAITTARTRAGGTFLLRGLEAGSYLIRGTHPHFEASVAIRAPAGVREKIEVQLRQGGEILGRVETPDGATLERFHVTVERFVPEVGIEGLESKHYRPRPGAHGDFLLTNLAPGSYDLRVDPPGYGPGTVSGVRVSGGTRTDNVVIRLSAGGTIAGSVVDSATGKGIPGAEVRISDSTVWGRNLPRERVRADEEGEFVLSGITPGRRGLRVRASGYVTTIRTVEEVREGSESHIDVFLDPSQGERAKVQFFGIGAVLKTNPDGTVAIRQVVEGGPGSRFGLKAGDVIVQVNGRDASSLGLGRVVEAIRGEEDTSVTLLVERRGESAPFEVSVDRGQVQFDARPH